MKAKLLALSAVVLVACVSLQDSAAQGDAVGRVNAIFDRLESQWLESLDVSPSLAPGRRDLATLLRKNSSLAESWQLEPKLVADMTDEQIADFVIMRANTVLACGLAQLSQRSLAEPPARTPAPRPNAAPQAAVPQALWKSPPVEGRLRMSPNCAVLLEEGRQPASLTSKSDLGLVDRLMTRFVQPKSQQALFEPLADANLRAAAGARLMNNVAYLRKEYGGMPEQEPDLQDVLGPKETTQVFSRQVLMFQAFIASTTPGRGGKPFDRAVLVIPLTQ